jgi:hypothetical protein
VDVLLTCLLSFLYSQKHSRRTENKERMENQKKKKKGKRVFILKFPSKTIIAILPKKKKGKRVFYSKVSKQNNNSHFTAYNSLTPFMV